MSNTIKNQKSILQKLRIEKLNEMQEETQLAIHSCPEVVLLSPTGTGKTLAFLLPLIAEMDEKCEEIQTVVVVPSRELAIQIEQVAREMGTGYKVNAFYGGRSFSKDRIDLNRRPALLIATPGRLADHLRRKTFTTEFIKALVLDEFDKSLEIGFESDMTDISAALRDLKKKVLTSATQEVDIPGFVRLHDPHYVNYLDEKISELQIKLIQSPTKDKLETLVNTLRHLGNQPGIIFCNFKDSIQRVSDYLKRQEISHGCFYGGMEQQDRERALIKFRNGTHQLLISTDLAARGIDVPEIKFILHYHLPIRSQEFIHRNGRTARMHSEGTAYVLRGAEEKMPDFIDSPEVETLNDSAPLPSPSEWTTIFVSGGRKDKISKGDIAGLLFKKGELSKDAVGIIELKLDCAFVAVKAAEVDDLISRVNNERVKKKKVRIYEI